MPKLGGRGFIGMAFAGLATWKFGRRGWWRGLLAKNRQCDEFVAIAGCAHADNNHLARLVAIAVKDGKQNIIYSDDYAMTFHLANAPPYEGKMVDIAVLNYQYWCIGCDDGTLWHTENAGKLWEKDEYIVIPTDAQGWALC